MPIVSKPRQIRIDLDPDMGFPVALSIESARFVEENGTRVADLPSHVESLDPESDLAKTVLGEMVASAAAALFPYQAEVQRLARDLELAKGDCPSAGA